MEAELALALADTSDDLTPRDGQAHGTQYSCGCRDAKDDWLFPGVLYRVREEPTLWWMGLDRDGQAQYLCDDCKAGYCCVRPLMP